MFAKIKLITSDIKQKLLENKVVKYLVNFYNKVTQNTWVTYVIFLYVVGLLVFGYTLVNNSFVIPVSGDFVVQEIPFYYNGYDDWWTAISTGKFPLWDEQAILGVNNIGANSFYYLFNIFFMPVLLFPRSLVPQAQAFMILTKIVLAGVGMRKLLEVFKISLPTSLIISTAYAFCGWNFFYLWFNHFFEMAVLMPFYLLAIEICLRKKNPMPLIFAIFIIGVTNYNYLIAMCFTGVIYAVFRYFQRIKIMNEMNQEEIRKGSKRKVHVAVEIILKGIMCYVLGLALTGIILVPCFNAVLANPRVTEASYLDRILEAFTIKDWGQIFDLLTKWEASNNASEILSEKYRLYPLVSFFFPNVSCYNSTLFVTNGYDDILSSLNVYTPLTLMLIPSIFTSIKEKKISHLIAFVGIIAMLFTPFVYYCFSGFTNEAYGRWQLFIVAIYCIYIAIQLDKKDKMPRWYFDVSVVVTLIIQFLLLNRAKEMGGMDGTSTSVLNDERILVAHLSMVGTIILYLYYRTQLKKSTFSENLRYLLALEIIIVGNVVCQMQGTYDYNNVLYGGKDNIASEIRLAQKISENDSSYYRVFTPTADRTGTNLGMSLGTRGLGAFHSVYNYELNEFLNWSQVKYTTSYDGWSMGIHEKRVNLDTFLGTKYYIVKNDDTNVPFGYEEYMSTDTHSVYINTNFINLGTSHTTLYNSSSYSREGYNSINSSSKTFVNELSYLNGAIVDSETQDALLTKYTHFESKKHTEDENVKSSLHEVNNGTVKVLAKNASNTFDEEVVVTGSSNTSALKELRYGSIITQTFEKSKVCNFASTSNPCYVDVIARMGENLSISLYGKNDKLLVSDSHMIHGYNDVADIKCNRGFYVYEPVEKIVINVVDNFKENKYLMFPKVFFEYYSDYLDDIAYMKENAVKNVVVHSSDEITFDTDYQEERVVVLNIPIDKGWSIVDENNEELEIIKVQGGFIGFVAPKGNKSYRLTYVTPLLETGLKLTYLGTFLTVICYATIIYLNDKKKYKELITLR